MYRAGIKVSVGALTCAQESVLTRVWDCTYISYLIIEFLCNYVPEFLHNFGWDTNETYYLNRKAGYSSSGSQIEKHIGEKQLVLRDRGSRACRAPQCLERLC